MKIVRTMKEVADFCMRNERTVRGWRAEPEFPTLEPDEQGDRYSPLTILRWAYDRGRYDKYGRKSEEAYQKLKEAGQSVEKRDVRPSANKSQGDDPLRAEKIKLTRAQRIGCEIANEQARGKSVPTDYLYAAFTKLGARHKDVVMKLRKLGTAEGNEAADLISAELEAMVKDARELLSSEDVDEDLDEEFVDEEDDTEDED